MPFYTCKFVFDESLIIFYFPIINLKLLASFNKFAPYFLRFYFLFCCAEFNKSKERFEIVFASV